MSRASDALAEIERAKQNAERAQNRFDELVFVAPPAALGGTVFRAYVDGDGDLIMERKGLQAEHIGAFVLWLRDTFLDEDVA